MELMERVAGIGTRWGIVIVHEKYGSWSARLVEFVTTIDGHGVEYTRRAVTGADDPASAISAVLDYNQ